MFHVLALLGFGAVLFSLALSRPLQRTLLARTCVALALSCHVGAGALALEHYRETGPGAPLSLQRAGEPAGCRLGQLVEEAAPPLRAAAAFLRAGCDTPALAAAD